MPDPAAGAAMPPAPPGRTGLAYQSVRFTVLLGLIAALPPLSIDINVPTLVALQGEFATTAARAGLTITLFMVGFALGQFTAGPLSDRRGRRPVLLGGLGLYVLASLGCAWAAGIGALASARLLQGMGAGACTVMAITIVGDLFKGEAARIRRSYLTVVFVLAPILAPSIGAAVLTLWGWRPIYGLLGAAGLALMLLVWGAVPESRPPGATRARLPATWRAVLTSRRFTGVAIVNALSYGALFAFIAGSAQVLMGGMGLGPRLYAAVFAGSAISLSAGAWINGRLARRGVGVGAALSSALILSAVTAILLLPLLAAGAPLAALAPVLAVHICCRGVIAPNAQHAALDGMTENAGTAASLLGVTQILTGALSSGAVALLQAHLGALAMGGVIAVLSLASLVAWLMLGAAERGHPALAPTPE